MSSPDPIIVYGSTSLVLVDTQVLTSSQSAVVLLSSVADPGVTVTIRDSLGYLSSPQSIVVSTMDSIRFADGTSSIRMTQPYSYLTVSSRDANSWNIINTFAFPQNQTVANLASLSTTAITTSTLYSENNISTNALVADSLLSLSSSRFLGTTYLSTLVVGTELPVYNTNPGYVAYIEGSLTVKSTLNVQSSVQVAGSVSTGGSVFIGGAFSTLGSLNVAGSIQTAGSIYAPNGSLQSYGINVSGPAFFGDTLTFSNVANFTSSLTVSQSIQTPILSATTLSLGSTLSLQNKTIQARANDLYITSPITAPSISTNYLTASNAIQTSTLTVTQSILAPTASSVLFSSATIQNPNGSLTVSSITASSAVLSNALQTDSLNLSSLFASTITLNGDLYATAQGYLGINTVVAENLSTNSFYANTILSKSLSTNRVAAENLFVNTSIVANNLSTCYMSNVLISNPDGILYTGNVQTEHAFLTSTFTISSGNIAATNSTLYLLASTVAMDYANIQRLDVNTFNTSTLYATKLIVGATPSTMVGPTFYLLSSISTQNVTISGGTGNYLSPITVASVKPSAIGPGQPYPVSAAFQINWNGPVLPAFYERIAANLTWANENACDLKVYAPDMNQVAQLTGLYNANQTYSGSTIITTTPSTSALYLTGTMYGFSAFTLNFQALSNAFYSLLDTTSGINMQNGILQWPYSLNATTIQNTYNDISTRNLFYYGSLSFTSDPVLKEQIEDADLFRCYSTISDIPLVRYKFKDSYLSTFQQSDAHRLGFLATDVATYFPKSVFPTNLNIDEPGLPSTIRTIDTQQIDMAHIGATKYLMKEVEQLTLQVESALSTIKSKQGFLKTH